MNNKGVIEATNICNLHLVVEGPVERTIRENGTVKRVHRCGKCGDLFKTTEVSDDHLAKVESERADVMAGWHRKARESENLVDGVKMIFEALERLKEQVRVAPGPEEWERED